MKTSTLLLGAMLAAGMAFAPAAAADHNPENDEIHVDASGPIQDTQTTCFEVFPGAHVVEEERVNEEAVIFVGGNNFTVGGEEAFVPGVIVQIGDENHTAGGFWLQIPEKTITIDDIYQEIVVDETVRVDEEAPGVTICVEHAS